MSQQKNKKSSSLLKKAEDFHPKYAQEHNKNKKFRDIILTEKRISDYQLLNKNIKRKLSVLEQQSIPANAQHSSRNMGLKQQLESKRSLAYSPMKRRLESKQKYTNQQRNIINEYKREIDSNFRADVRNPFEMALVEMIEKQQQIVEKRQKDLQFWKNRVKTLEQKYHQLQSGDEPQQ